MAGCDLKPGPNPLESLAAALAANAVVGKGIDVGDLKKRFGTEPDRLHLTVRVALHSSPETRRVMVLVDQFEEIFTLCRDDVLRRALIDNLCHASSVMLGQTVVVLTMRADFYGKCSAYPTLAAALSDHRMLVGPMTEDELQRAIESPAQLAGYELEPGLTEILLQDVKSQAGALPLLEHALLELWKHREGRRLTVAAYRKIGKLQGALEQHANKVYGSLNPDEQDFCRQILLRLTQPGEGTEDIKRRALRKELGDSDSIDTVIQKLADARLITTEGGEPQAAETDDQRRYEAYVEVSHEALIRGWPMLRDWIDANRERLRIQHRLSDAAREWDAQKHNEAYLYRGVRLAEAEEWSQIQGDNLNRLEREFLEASKALRDRQLQEQIRTAKRLRRRFWVAVKIAVVAVVLTVVAVVLAVVALQAQRVAETQRNFALARQLAAQTGLLVKKMGVAGAVPARLLATESLRHAATLEGYLAWSEAINLLPFRVTRLSAGVTGWLGVQFNAVPPDRAAELGLHPNVGVEVTEVRPDDPAEKGGIKSGDIIEKINGEDVKSDSSLLGGLLPGSATQIQIIRDGRAENDNCHSR